MALYNVEKGLISKLIEDGDFLSIQEKQIINTYFSGVDKKVFTFIQEYYLKYSTTPTPKVIEVNFPAYSLNVYDFDDCTQKVGTKEPLNFWCDEVRLKVKHNKLADVTEDMAKALENSDPEKAFEHMKQGVLVIENEIEESKTVDITKNTENRKKEYEKRKLSGGMIGIETGITHLDNILKGLQKKQLIICIASTGVGKTYLECIIGAYCQISGLKVLQFVTEMSEEVMQDRYDAILMGMLIGEFNYNRFKSGKLTEQEQLMYYDFLDNHLPDLVPLIIETAVGVSSVSAKIEQHKPDIVFIDGVYLMEDERGSDQDWLRVLNINRDLKSLAKNKGIPIFVNSQADNTTSVKTGPELGNIGYAKGMGQDADVVLAMFVDQQMITDKEMLLKVLKHREGTKGKVTMTWDFTKMLFESIYVQNETKDFEDEKGENKAEKGVIEV